MGYSDVVFWLWVIDSIGLILVSSLFIFIGSSIIYLSIIAESSTKGVKTKSFKIKLVSALIILSFITVCTALYPSQKIVGTYIIAKEVDNYNLTHEDSNFSPNSILENTDNSIQDIAEFIKSLTETEGEK